jgi:hypothetical protein
MSISYPIELAERQTLSRTPADRMRRGSDAAIVPGRLFPECTLPPAFLPKMNSQRAPSRAMYEQRNRHYSASPNSPGSDSALKWEVHTNERDDRREWHHALRGARVVGGRGPGRAAGS